MFKLTDAYLVGYYGMKNSGDDALLYAAAWGVKHLLNCNRIKASMFEDLGCEWVNDGEVMGKPKFRGHHRLCYYRAAWRSKRVIFGGGSVFHSASDINQKRHMIQTSCRANSMAIGVGLGPFENLQAEQACKQFLNECGFVGVRDRKSYEIARYLAPEANVKLTFDLAPALLCNPNFNFKYLDRRGIAFNFCQSAIDAYGNTDAKLELQRVKKACHLIQRVWEDTREKIYLIDFNGHPEFGDHHVHNKIMAQLPCWVPVQHIPYDNNPVRLLQRLFSYKAMVGMRLHAAILSYLAGTPVVALQYHEKCRQWSRQIGMSDNLQFDANEFSPEEVSVPLCNGINMQFQAPQLPVTDAISQCLLNWSNEDVQHRIFCNHPTLQQA